MARDGAESGSGADVIEGVYLSRTLDLPAHFAKAFERYGGRVRLRLPEEIDDPARVMFALAWAPAANAFTPYPNVRLAAPRLPRIGLELPPIRNESSPMGKSHGNAPRGVFGHRTDCHTPPGRRGCPNRRA